MNEVNNMRKWLTFAVALLVCLLAFAAASAEISTELQIRNSYDRDGHLVLQEYVNAAGQTVYAEDTGYASVKYVYKSGNLSETIWYNADGQVTDTAGGWARLTARYGQENLLLSQT